MGSAGHVKSSKIVRLRAVYRAVYRVLTGPTQAVWTDR
jgi:hypothetical protein